MTTFVLMALSNPAAGLSDEAVAQWYDGEHIPQIRAAIPGVGDVRRYRAAEAQPTPDGSVAYRYLTVYAIDADEAGSIVAALGSGLASGAVKQGGVLDPVSTVLGVYGPA